MTKEAKAMHGWSMRRQGGQPRQMLFPHHRILIVDDHVDTANTEALLLIQLGQSVQVAFDGPTALRIAEEFEPKIVLLDLDMPVMNGIDVARALRRMRCMEHARIIAHTGFARPEYRAATEAAGFDDYVNKPAPLTALIKILGDKPHG